MGTYGIVFGIVYNFVLGQILALCGEGTYQFC